MTVSWCESSEPVCDEDVAAETTSFARTDDVIAQLYREHRAGLQRHLQSMVKDPDIAEELLQDTFIRLSRMPAIQTIRQIRPFLYKIATNLALDFLRASKRMPETESDEVLTEWASEEPAQLEFVAHARRIEQLQRAIESLPPRARETLILARLQEKTLKEVAVQLGVSQTMVEKHLRNAMKKCREYLNADLH